jgi:hypothetical protein
MMRRSGFILKKAISKYTLNSGRRRHILCDTKCMANGSAENSFITVRPERPANEPLSLLYEIEP